MWALIILFYTGPSRLNAADLATTSVQGFETERLCLDAGERVSRSPPWRHLHVATWCIPVKE